MDKKAKKEEWKKGDRFNCEECGNTYWFNGSELIMEPCGKCEENVWKYINILQTPWYLNTSNDRICCHVCGKLFKLRNSDLVHAPLDISLYNPKP